jgi:hypothetical protein
MLWLIKLFITVHITNIILAKKISKSSALDEEVNCISLGQNDYNAFGDNDANSLQPTDCTSIVSNCCYAKINLNYGANKISNSYCFLIAGDKNKFFKTIINKYTDELKWYAQQTYGMYEQYQRIGNNLLYTYWSNYTCYQQPKTEDFSSYNDTICAHYNGDDCDIINDETNFQNFAKTIYDTATANLCSTYAADGGCVDPYSPTYQNNAALQPVLDLMIHSVGLDTLNKTEEKNNEVDSWPNECVAIPDVDIQLICSDEYVSGNYIKFSFGIFILLFMFIY